MKHEFGPFSTQESAEYAKPRMSFKEYVDHANGISLSIRTADKTLNQSVPLTSIQGTEAQIIDLGKSIIAKNFNQEFPQAL